MTRVPVDLGAYFHSGWAGTAIWSIIEIDGLSMRDAISNWWNGGKKRNGWVELKVGLLPKEKEKERSMRLIP